MISEPRNVAVLVFDEVEVLDFAGPFEVFGVAREMARPSPFHVFTVSITGQPVEARGRLTVVPRYSIHNCPDPDILIVPGGAGTRPLLKHRALLQWLRERAATAELTLSVCTGALLLAKAGLLEGAKATTHHDATDHLALLSPSTRVISGERFVTSSDRILTSGGISAGIDLSLHVVERLLGSAVRAKVEEEMEYGTWKPQGE